MYKLKTKDNITLQEDHGRRNPKMICCCVIIHSSRRDRCVENQFNEIFDLAMVNTSNYVERTKSV